MLITVLNQSKIVTRHDARAMTGAIGYQLRHHAAPAWNRAAPHTSAIDRLEQSPVDAHLITILDDADQANALGYHDLTPDGRPYARVFVKPTLESGGGVLNGSLSVCSVLSHEALELFGDPLINDWSDNGPGYTLWAKELCDACEALSYDVVVYGKPYSVSDFLLPEFFTANPFPGAEFDYLGAIKQPFSILPGGYTITLSANRISVTYGAEYAAFRKADKGHPASRTQRRIQAIKGDLPPLPGPGDKA